MQPRDHYLYNQLQLPPSVLLRLPHPACSRVRASTLRNRTKRILKWGDDRLFRHGSDALRRVPHQGLKQTIQITARRSIFWKRATLPTSWPSGTDRRHDTIVHARRIDRAMLFSQAPPAVTGHGRTGTLSLGACRVPCPVHKAPQPRYVVDPA